MCHFPLYRSARQHATMSGMAPVQRPVPEPLDFSDALLAARARAGERPAFDALVRRYQPLVLRYFERRLRRRDAAEEATQETFARAFTRVETLRCASRVRSWLFAVARHVLLESFRATRPESLEPLRSDESLEARLPGPPIATPEALLLGRELQGAIDKALASLPRARRAALLLRVSADSDYEEIARRFGWPASKVKNEIHRARLQLRRLLCAWVCPGAAPSPCPPARRCA